MDKRDSHTGYVPQRAASPPPPVERKRKVCVQPRRLALVVPWGMPLPPARLASEAAQPLRTGCHRITRVRRDQARNRRWLHGCMAAPPAAARRPRMSPHVCARCPPVHATPPHPSQGLLKEKLQLEKVKTEDGRVRWTVAPIDEQLSFDKVWECAPAPAGPGGRPPQGLCCASGAPVASRPFLAWRCAPCTGARPYLPKCAAQWGLRPGARKHGVAPEPLLASARPLSPLACPPAGPWHRASTCSSARCSCSRATMRASCWWAGGQAAMR
jgi:hypothetical protein